MFSDHSYIFNRILSRDILEQLCDLWQKIAELAEDDALLITEENIEQDCILDLGFGDNHKNEKFCLLVSSQINALLFAHQISHQEVFQVSLTCEIEVINKFIHQLIVPLEDKPELHKLLLSLEQITVPQEKIIYNQFMMDLLEILVKNSSDFPQAYINFSPRFLNYKPLDIILHNRLEQERILNQMTLQINQNQNLLMIVQMTIEQVRSLFAIDRLVIYQLDFKLINQDNNTQLINLVSYETKSSENIKSVLHFRDEMCFAANPECRYKYAQGHHLIINDVVNSNLDPCLKKLMYKLEVKAKLVIPIIVQNQLWGFIIAHQCYSIRSWQPNEIEFIDHVAQYLAIAIYQSESYYQLQQQQDILEQQIERRATELRDALLAAEAASQSKSEFIGNMSHELRTPLTCVIGLSSTLLQWSFTEKETLIPVEKQRKYLQTIQDSGKKLMELINDILEFAQIEAGKSILNIKEFSLKNICFFLIKNIQKEAETHQIHLKLELLLEENEENFCGDPERIKQILLNLLSNGIKFTPVNGTVILRVWREGNYVLFQIEDTGIGISNNQLSLLFEKFQQLEPSRQRIYGGTGLGLALTKQLVELHQGKIEVESVVDRGSIFTVQLPNLSNYISHEKIQSNYQESPSKKTIVLITQNEEIATLISEMLTVAKYHVIWLIDDVISVKQIKIIKPCLVIIDFNLTQIPSSNLIEEIKQLQTITYLKIMMLIDQVISENPLIYEDTKVDEYLTLPIQPQLLLHKVNYLLLNNNNP